MNPRDDARGLVVEELIFTPRGDANRSWGPFSFQVLPGEIMGLSGASGSGKSLLLRSLADLDDHAGRIKLNGVVQAELPAPSWRRRVGMLPAETAWWFDSVGEHFDEAWHSVIGEIGFSQEVMEWPVSRLSAGEKQRLALARLLVREPEALLLDEPTANLDSNSRSIVEALILKYQETTGCPILWVGHSREQLQRTSRHVFEMRDHQIHPLDR